ncbi:hypothetical protein [Bermanella sp. R86510]|uniref:hypothetical protein n=1 Tax=unclassified Bermanella TaxID=2627862 RepID=UPI0037C86443
MTDSKPDKQYYITQHGSTTHNPDFNWCQAQETITMLALAVAQVESSMKDGEKSISTLAQTFSRMSRYIKAIKQATEDNSDPETYKQTIQQATSQLEQDTEESIVAFQFYDRISQRLDHVCNSLDRLGGLIIDTQNRESPEKWQALQEHIKSSYTMEAERIMFEHILRGEGISEALQIYRHHFDKEDDDNNDKGDEVELF